METHNVDQTGKRSLDSSDKLGTQKKTSLLKNYLLPRAVFLTVGFPKDAFGSIDITNKCNLRCSHCYFFEQDLPEELTAEEWKGRFEEMGSGWKRTRAMTWVGGEPLLRKELIDIGRKHFDHNLIVTNGLVPLPDWKDVYFHVSIDGDEETHERLRNQRGIYKKTMENVGRPDLDVSIAYCISSENIHCIEKVLKEWRGTGVKGFLFNFYTPIETIKDPLFPGWEERDEVLDRLIEWKKGEYSDFILNEPRVLELMKQKNAKRVTDSCLFEKKGFALDPNGNRKEKCMMGPTADCDRCGCIVPFHLHYRSERRKILTEMASDLSGYMGSRVRRLFGRA